MQVGAVGNEPGVKYVPPPLKKNAWLPPCTSFEAACMSGAGTAVSMFLDSDEKRFKPILLAPPEDYDPKWKGGIENVPLIVRV